MAEYIERKIVEDSAEYDIYHNLVVPIRKVRDVPAADVAPVVHSRWVQLNNTQKHYCFECGADFDLYAYCKRKFNYCPYCGAKMDLENK